MDALGAAEDTNWVYRGSDCFPPAYERCLIGLSHGGGDAIEMREFDVATRSFVEDGFFVPEARSIIAWEDENTLLIGTDFGEGTLTESGYPRFVKRWRRGTGLAEAETVFEAKPEDVATWAQSVRVDDEYRQIVAHRTSIFEGS